MDYTDFRSQSEQVGNQGNAYTAARRMWWKLPGDEAANSITQIIRLITSYNSGRTAQQVVSARLYGNVSLLGLSGLTYSKVASVQPGMRDRVSYNIVQSVVDTVIAKIGKNKPRPLFVSSRGQWEIQRKAKKLNQFVDGLFYENKAYQLGLTAFRDACVWGDGFLHVYPKEGRVCFERVLPHELYADELEGFYGFPRQIHRVKPVDRQVLIDAFPGKTSVLREAHTTVSEDKSSKPTVSDLIMVRESWHLPSSKGAKDGKHFISIDGHALTPMEDWPHDFFPFARMPWCPRLHGFWSQGLAEQLQNIQLEINKLLWVIQRSFHLAGTFRIWVKNGSKIVKEHLNNEIGTIISGNEEPKYLLAPIVQPEIYSHLQTLVQRAYEQPGVSMLSAVSQKPAGLNSGKALREYNDIESDRFNTVGRQYEQFYLDLARLSISCAKDIYEEDGKLEVQVPGKRFLTTIDWKEIDLEEDEYVLQCFPVSSLPNEPAGRLQTIQEYIQAGMIDPDTGRRLLNFPDIDQVECLQDAAEEYLNQILEDIVDKGKFTAPEPFDDLVKAERLALQFYAYGKAQGLSEERLELLRKFMSQVGVLKQAAMPPPMPVGAPGAGGAGATPQAPPVPPQPSDLIQNVPGAAA